MNYIDSKLITLNSKDSVQNNASMLSDVMFKFKDILKKEAGIFYSTIALISCEIPVSFFNVNVNNYTLYYSVDSVVYNLVISEGNYNATTFKTAFQSAFAAGLHAKTIIISINRLNGFFTFIVSGFTLQLLYKDTTMYEVLGLLPLTNYTITSSQTAPFMANFLGVKKIKVISAALSNSGFDSNGLGSSHLLHTISVNQPAFGLITFQNTLPNYSKLKEKIINEIDIQLLDENGAKIDLNGIHWSLSISINVYRRFNEQDDILNVDPIKFIDESLAKTVKTDNKKLRNKNMEELDLLLE
jgi:hypothetical protein